MELAGDCTAFSHEQILPHQRLPGVQNVAGSFTYDVGNLAHFGQIESDGHFVKAVQRQRNFSDIGIAGALAHAVDRALDP